MCNLEQALTIIRQTLSKMKNFESFKKNRNALYFEYGTHIKTLEWLSKYQPSIREMLKKYVDLLCVSGLSKNIHNDRFMIAKKSLENIQFQLENGCIKPISFMKVFLENVDIKPSVNILGVVEVSIH